MSLPAERRESLPRPLALAAVTDPRSSNRRSSVWLSLHEIFHEEFTNPREPYRVMEQVIPVNPSEFEESSSCCHSYEPIPEHTVAAAAAVSQDVYVEDHCTRLMKSYCELARDYVGGIDPSGIRWQLTEPPQMNRHLGNACTDQHPKPRSHK